MNFIVPIIALVVLITTLFTVGIKAQKLVSTPGDFLLSGRELSIPVNLFSFFAGTFASSAIVTNSSFTMQYGLLGTLIYALAAAGFGMIPYGLLMAKPIRRSGAMTVPEFIQMRFNAGTRRILSIFALVGIVAMTGSNVLALSNVVSAYFSIDIKLTAAIAIFVFLFFTYLSGMWGVALTDFIQACVCLVGGPLIIITLIKVFGSPNEAISNWMSSNGTNPFLQGTTGNTLQLAQITHPSVITTILGFGLCIVWGGQHYFMRVASSRSEGDAKKMVLFGALMIFILVFVVGVVGLYSGGFMSDMFVPNGDIPTDSAYGTILTKFPYGMGVFLLVFAVAASISTLSSLLMGSVQLAVRDFYNVYINKSPSDKQFMNASKVAIVIICIAVYILCLYPGGIVFLLAFAASWIAPAGYIVLLGIISPRITNTGALWGAAISLIVSCIWTVLNLTNIPVGGENISFYIHLTILNAISLFITTIVVSLFTKPKYFASKEWLQREASKITAVQR